MAFRHHPRGKKGSALIMTLGALVLISAILLVFFDEGMLNREISYSSAGQYRADMVAHTALDTIAGDLRTEIAAGSEYTTNSAYAGAIVAPCRVGDQGVTNLVKQSVSLAGFWNGSGYDSTLTAPIRAAANNSTQTPSANGRVIKLARWNQPGLLADPGAGSTPQLSLPSGQTYTPPDWIVLTRQGAITNANTMPSVASLADKTASNPSFAVGRYAYTVYDEGALLDVNVAGFPDSGGNSLGASSYATQRGILPQVDLANLLGNAVINDANASTDATALVNWRNQASAATASSYTNYVFNQGATNGFGVVAPGDQSFVDRRDLINYIKSNSSIPTAALPYLGTFTRDSDQPSYYPDPSRAVVTATGTLSDYNLNPDVKGITVQYAFTRASDNTQANVGDPLLKHRFPLSLLGLFNNPAANATAIQKYFCMTQRNDGMWDYVDPDSGTVMTTVPTIKTLAQVAATSPGREPTFWELLQAGILTGSLGVELQGSTTTANNCTITQNQNPTRQIFSIGLSLIDQYDADDNPTVIRLAGTPTGLVDATVPNVFIAGDENLPYIAWIAQNHFRDTTDPISPPVAGANTYVDGYLLFALWNPHRNAASASTGTYRIRVVDGSSYIGITRINGVPYTGISGNGVTTSPVVTNSNTSLVFQTSASQMFTQITPLMPANCIITGGTSASGTTTSTAEFPIGSANPLEVGILLGQMPTQTPSPEINSTGTSTTSSSLQIYYNQPLTIVLEKLVGTNYVPYQILPRYQARNGNDGTQFAAVSAQMNAGQFTPNQATSAQGSTWPTVIIYFHSDPRTNRFGLPGAGAGAVKSILDNSFNLIDTGSITIEANFAPTVSISPPFTTSNFYPADYAYNVAGTAYSRYTDRDGVLRKGDANPTSPIYHGAASPYPATSLDARPVMLNRPFASVAEMGYAFRDDPWRTLNFSSSDSADGGLLDLFCLNPDDNAARAGVVDVNGASQPVLETLLLDASRDPASTYPPLTTTQASTIAGAIRAQLGAPDAPTWTMRNVADVPTLTTQIASSLPDSYKFSREVVARSLADVTNTRTWNLMIDVIAQSGRYTATSRTLNDFTVEGERRYWLHLALDRFTGKIIDSQIEAVSE